MLKGGRGWGAGVWKGMLRDGVGLLWSEREEMCVDRRTGLLKGKEGGI